MVPYKPDGQFLLGSGNIVYYGDKPIYKADADSFRVINSTYSKDKLLVYFKNNVVTPADPASFVYFNSNFGKDNHSVYHMAIKLASANPNSFEVLSELYAKDKYFMYFEWQPFYIEEVHQVNIISRRLIRTESDLFFGAHKINTSYGDFKYLKYDYWTDGSSVFVGKKDLGVSPKSFQAISASRFMTATKLYSQRGNSTWAVDSELSDFSTYTSLSEVYSYDKNYIYHLSQKLDLPEGIIDPNKIQILAEDYLAYEERLFFRNTLMMGVAPQKLSSLNYNFIFRGETNLIYGNHRLDDSLATDFKILSPDLVISNEHVYQFGSLKESIDFNSLEFVAHYTFHDNSAFYCSNSSLVTDADPASFENLSWHLGQDSSNIYRKSFCSIVKLDLLDRESFEVIVDDSDAFFVKDKNGIYTDFVRTKLTNLPPNSIYLGGFYFSNEKSIFYLPDGETEFKEIEVEPTDEFRLLGYSYVSFGNKLYFQGTLVDTKSTGGPFNLSNWYSKEGRSNKIVVSYGETIPVVDISSFNFLGEATELSYDRYNVYLKTSVLTTRSETERLILFPNGILVSGNLVFNNLHQLIIGLDGGTFRPFDGSHMFFRDANHIVYAGSNVSTILNDLDVNSSFIINYFDSPTHITDGLVVYFRGTLITSADLESFIVLDYLYSRDKNNCYKAGVVVNSEDCLGKVDKGSATR